MAATHDRAAFKKFVGEDVDATSFSSLGDVAIALTQLASASDEVCEMIDAELESATIEAAMGVARRHGWTPELRPIERTASGFFEYSR